MTMHREQHRAPTPARNDNNSTTGRNDALRMPLEIRNLNGGVDASLRKWVNDRLGRQLGKFAPQIERVEVRFDDVNGNKGGVDRTCMVHVVLSSLPPVVVEMLGQTDLEAFDLAAGRAERATRRNLEKHGFSTGHKKRHHHDRNEQPHDGMSLSDPRMGDGMLDSEMGKLEPLFGKRVGQGHDQLMLLQQRPEKVRRDIQVDTSKPGTSANDRKVGYGHTGKRNTKLNTAGMSYALEDSTDGKPSRKSTRGSSNRIKPDNGLTLKTKSSVLSPKSIAARSPSRTH